MFSTSFSFTWLIGSFHYFVLYLVCIFIYLFFHLLSKLYYLLSICSFVKNRLIKLKIKDNY